MDKQETVPQAFADLISRHSTRLTDADARLLDVLIQDPIRGAMENGKDSLSGLACIPPRRFGWPAASALRVIRSFAAFFRPICLRVAEISRVPLPAWLPAL